MKNYKNFIKEGIDDIIHVRIKPNVKNKYKWYYGTINAGSNLTGEIVKVRKSQNTNFDDCFHYTDSLFIDIEDCEVIGTNIDKYNL